MFRICGNPGLPGLEIGTLERDRRLGASERTVEIDRIRVARLDLATHSVCQCPVDDLVHPAEIVPPLLPLALRPSALETDRLDPEERQVVPVLAEIAVIAIQAFAADRIAAVLDLGHRTLGERADSHQPGIQPRAHTVL